MPKEIKIVVLGSGGVGKSALTVRFVQNIFVLQYDPTIEDSYRKQVEVDGQNYMLEILDTAGTEQFTAMRDLYMKNGQVPLVIIGNKCDLEDQRVVTTEEGEALARQLGCSFFEASAKTEINVEEGFNDLVRQINQRYGVAPQLKPVKKARCLIL